MVTLTIALLLQLPPTQTAKPENPGDMVPRKAWAGCLQAGSAPSSYRLNLDPGTGVAGPNDPVSLGDPFVQLLGDAAKLDFARYAGKHVTIKGKELSQADAEHEAALRPDLQEANATAAGTGGRSDRHLRYVRVQSIAEAPGACH